MNATERNIREAVGDRVFGATFEKADGTIREGTFRLNVTKDQTGKGLSYSPSSRGNLIVWDMSAEGYRTIKLERLHSIRSQGFTYDFTTGGEG